MIYDIIVAVTLPLWTGCTTRTPKGGDRPLQYSKTVSKLAWKCLTLPKNDEDAEHVYFRPDSALQNLLDAHDHLYNEFTTRMYDGYTFRVVVQLELQRSQPILIASPEDPRISCNGWRMLEWWEPQIGFLSIPAQLPYLAVMQRIKFLRMEILLYGQPHLGFAALASMVDLRRLTLSFVGHEGKVDTPYRPWSSKWVTMGSTQGIDHEYWQAFLCDVLQHVPRTAEIHLDESSPNLGGEDCVGIAIESMRRQVTDILGSQGRKLAC